MVFLSLCAFELSQCSIRLQPLDQTWQKVALKWTTCVCAPEVLRNTDEEETAFMDDFDIMYEAPSTTTSWAGGAEMPDGLDEENLASNDYRDQVVTQFIAERSKYSRQADLEFKVSKSGDLWVKWGCDWKLLT